MAPLFSSVKMLPHTAVAVSVGKHNDKICPICSDDQLEEWVQFPCGKKICRTCLEKHVQTCPLEISKFATLTVFDPDGNPLHRYSCPFCKVAYTPEMEVQHHVPGTVKFVQQVKVRSLVRIPFAYQSFDSNMPSHILTIDEYCTMKSHFDSFLRQDRSRIELLLSSDDDSFYSSEEHLRRELEVASEVDAMQPPYIN